MKGMLIFSCFKLSINFFCSASSLSFFNLHRKCICGIYGSTTGVALGVLCVWKDISSSFPVLSSASPWTESLGGSEKMGVMLWISERGMGGGSYPDPAPLCVVTTYIWSLGLATLNLGIARGIRWMIWASWPIFPSNLFIDTPCALMMTSCFFLHIRIILFGIFMSS